MVNLISYSILATIVASGGIFLIRELRGRAGEPTEDNSDRLAHGDVVRLPAVASPFHGEGFNR